MRATTYIEIAIDIEFTAHKAERMTRHYPGCPADLEITNLSCLGIDFPEKMFDQFMKDYEDELEEACWEQVKYDREAIEVMAMEQAEHMLDLREVRQ